MKAPSNGDDEALKNCPPSKKQEVHGNGDSGEEPPELLVRPGDEEDSDLEHEQQKRITMIFVVVAQVLTQMTTLL
jgi:hypothetical protein